MEALIGERTTWLLVAVAIDSLVGELPNAWHPVAWFGRAAQAAYGLAPLRGRAAPFLAGAALAVALPAAAAAVVHLGLGAFGRAHPLARDSFAIFALQATFAGRALIEATRTIGRCVDAGGAPAARAELAALCSRDASTLDETSLLASATESLAENASDSVVAPLAAYVLFGLEGAVVYRSINTLDAMFGYRDHREWIGKAAARLDDAANLVPARLTAAFLWLAGVLHGGEGVRALRIWRRDRNRTPSPNGGHPMAMMAGLLGRRLDKPDGYVLGAEFPGMDAKALDRAIRIVRTAFVFAFASALVASELFRGF